MIAARFRFVLPEQFSKLPGLRSKAFLVDVDAYLRSDLSRDVVRKVGEPKELRVYEVPEYVDNAT